MTTAVQLAQSVAPGVSLGFKNRIINGGMVFDQRNAGALVSSPVAVGGYCLDRHAVYCSSGTNRFSVQQVADAPTGFVYSQKITVTNAGTPGASDENRTYHGIEGQNLQDFAYGTSAAVTSTLSFWVKTSVTGTYGVSLYNPTASKSYVMTYTVNSANTWEYKTVTFVGDTASAMATNNSGGLYLRFDLGNGTNYNTTSGSWVSGNYTRTSGCVTLCTNSGATWQNTGVQLEVGTAATSFEFRDYTRELQMCQRYYAKSYAQNTKPGTASTYAGIMNNYVQAASGYCALAFRFPVSMRTVPTITTYDIAGNSGKVYANGNNVTSDDQSAYTGTDGSAYAQASVLGTGVQFAAHYTASAEL